MIVTEWKQKAAVLLKQKRVLKPKEPSFKQSEKRKVYLSKRVRLVPYDTVRSESLGWYQDTESMRNIVGVATAYDQNKISQMYDWQNKNGLLYYIECLEEGQFRTVGDVWLSKDDYAIVIDEAYRNRHIGRLVTKYFIYKSKKMGRETMIVREIFNWNKASQKMFTSLKFYPFKEYKNSWSYRKKLTSLSDKRE
ncbi:GNAT family N-acetyltransferase [Enterococcus sp. LJL128]|uniref:GNAT family N-acetyltransferase n=1 Tax=Enterococcus sp. LJL51 TaxID=3416656 RepID=UPI003CFA743D